MTDEDRGWVARARASNVGRKLIPQADADGPDPAAQLYGIGVGNLLLTIGALLMLKKGFNTSRDWPEVFVAIEIIIIAVSILGSVADAIRSRSEGLVGARGRDARVPRATAPGLPEGILKILVFVFSLLSCVAVWQLVEETGGGVINPFAPLLTAPAVFAPFLARSWQTIAYVALIVLVFVWLVDETSGSAPADSWVYSGVATVMVLLAAFMASVKAGISPASGFSPNGGGSASAA